MRLAMVWSTHTKKMFNIERVTKNNVEQVKTINSVVLPLSYSASSQIYNHMVDVGLSFLARHKSKPVGALGCRIEKIKSRETSTDVVVPKLSAHVDLNDGKEHLRVNILTLAVLAPYRGQGVGKMLMKRLFHDLSELMKQEDSIQIDQIYLHVQTVNQEAIRFYEYFGFVKQEMIKEFYKRIEHRDCYLYVLHVSDNNDHWKKKL
jgi:ribosomal protein S18 acetylase RimI-like enzyme